MSENCTENLSNSKKRLEKSSFKKYSKKVRTDDIEEFGESSSEKCSNKVRTDDKEKFGETSSEVDDVIDSFPDFSNLPDVVLLKVFEYLPCIDKCHAARVCRRWHLLSKSPYLWRHLSLQNVNANMMVKLFPALSGVTFLELECNYKLFPLCLSEIFIKLNESCPSLKTFIVEAAMLVKNVYSNWTSRHHIGPPVYRVLNASLLQSAKEQLNDSARQFYELEYCTEKMNSCHFEPLLPELQVLSLRKTMFNSHNLLSEIGDSVLPNLKVFDLNHSTPSCREHILKCPGINCLEELYLAGSTLLPDDVQNLLKTAVKLKVLDLERINLRRSIIYILEKYGKNLKELYLSHTKIKQFYLAPENIKPFPELEVLCVRVTRFNSKSLAKLLNACPSLRSVNVSQTKVSEKELTHLSKKLKEKLILDDKVNRLLYCDHFRQNNHYHKQRS